MNVQEAVLEFHQRFGLPIGTTPSLNVGITTHRLRHSLIAEELSEFLEACTRDDLVGVADALGDLAYVVYGAAVTYGIDLDTVVAEIHRSNMTKLGGDGKPLRREDGKILKGPSYESPHLKPILEAQKP